MKKVSSSQKARSKVRMMFLGVKRQQQGAGDQLQIKLQKTAEITYFQTKKQRRRYHLTYLEVWK